MEHLNSLRILEVTVDDYNLVTGKVGSCGSGGNCGNSGASSNGGGGGGCHIVLPDGE